MGSKKNLPKDMELWSNITKDVKPIKIAARRVEPKKKKEEVAVRYSIDSALLESGSSRAKNLVVNDKSGIAHKQAVRIDKGVVEIDATIDLHGMTLQAAYENFKNFIERAYSKNYRLLLVITGKGLKSLEGKGKIKNALIDWTNEISLRSKIVRVSEASRKDGGSGAYYILLKRRR